MAYRAQSSAFCKYIGGLLKAARETTGEKQVAAAASMGISGSQLSRIERGTYPALTIPHAAQYLQYYGLSLNDAIKAYAILLTGK